MSVEELLAQFAAEHRQELVDQPQRAANMLSDLLGVREDVTSSQARALTALVADGTVGSLLEGRTGVADVAGSESVTVAAAQWAAALAAEGGGVPRRPDAPPSPAPTSSPAPFPAPVLRPPIVVEPGGSPTLLEVDPAPTPGEARPQRNVRVPLIVGAAAVLVLAVIAVVLVSSGGGDGDDATASDDSLSGASVVVEDDTVQFDAFDVADGVSATRSWTLDGTSLSSVTEVTNDNDSEQWVIYDELIPQGLQPAVDAEDVEPDDDTRSIIDGSTIRYIAQLGAGNTLTVTYVAELDEEPSGDDLRAWASSWRSAYDRHQEDAEMSPRNADADARPDVDDVCPNDPGELNGCPDEDDDGVADADDECPGESGEAQGCPDEDDDGFADAADGCLGVVGMVDGCPDADSDGFGEGGSRDLGSYDWCPDQAGPASGCLNSDDDEVVDVSDPCPTVAGDLLGCPDADSDGFGEGNGDSCPDQPGTAAGCRDIDGDGWGDTAGDQCGGQPGPFKGCIDDPDATRYLVSRIDQFDAADDATDALYDPDDDDIIPNDRFDDYCREVRANYDGMRVDVANTISTYSGALSVETANLLATLYEQLDYNTNGVNSCAFDDADPPWKTGNWVQWCELFNPILTRIEDGVPYTCT